MEIELTNLRVVAVDGGTATGKSRLVEELAKLLRLKGVPVIHVSSGQLYRAVAYLALEDGRTKVAGKRGLSADQVQAEASRLVRKKSVEELLELAYSHEIAMHNGVVWIDGVPASVDEQLKAPGVGAVTPHGAGFLPVRQFVNTVIRRQINEFDGYVMIDGRDIGHSVVPDAPLKLLLIVQPHVAADRSHEHTVEEVIARDEADRRHKYGALRHHDDPGENVLVLATDEHTPESLRDHVFELMGEVFPELPDMVTAN